jgi:hypothetical protein
MSGSGLGYLEAAIFASCIPKPVPLTEYKESAEILIASETSSFNVGGDRPGPTGPGFGVPSTSR